MRASTLPCGMHNAHSFSSRVRRWKRAKRLSKSWCCYQYCHCPFCRQRRSPPPRTLMLNSHTPCQAIGQYGCPIILWWPPLWSVVHLVANIGTDGCMRPSHDQHGTTLCCQVLTINGHNVEPAFSSGRPTLTSALVFMRTLEKRVDKFTHNFWLGKKLWGTKIPRLNGWRRSTPSSSFVSVDKLSPVNPLRCFGS